MKTAEQILKELCERVTGNVHDYSHSWLLDAMEEYAQQRVEEDTRWIPVSELPPKCKWVLVTNGKWVGVGKYDPQNGIYAGIGHWQDENTNWIADPKFWRELPSPPNK